MIYLVGDIFALASAISFLTSAASLAPAGSTVSTVSQWAMALP